MLKKDLSSPGSSSIAQKIDSFMSSPMYIMVIMALTLIANIFGAELIVYTLFVLTVVYVCLFGKDLLPIIPMVICSYLAPSIKNNPGRNEDSIFSASGGGIVVGVLAVIVVLAFLFRVIRDRKTIFGGKHALLGGMLALSAAYLLGGIGSKNYTDHASQSIFFAFLNAAAIIVPYLLLAGCVDWHSTRKDYFAWVGFGAGCLLLCEIGWIYLTGNVIRDGIIERSAIYTGWGMYNNIGSTLAMMIPFPFYIATKYRKGWIGAMAGSLFLVGVVLTCSRASILCGGAIYCICVVLMLYFSSNRKANTFTVALFIGGVFVLVMFFGERLLNLFSSLLDQGLDPSNRDSIYRDGLLLFGKYPLFGGSFFSTEYAPWGWSTNAAFTSFFPPRWHNTYVQLLASCGALGLAAYGLHRWQTVKLFLRERKPENIFIACSVIVLLTTSLFDCHFFNIGPVLFYSMALAFAENCAEN